MPGALDLITGIAVYISPAAPLFCTSATTANFRPPSDIRIIDPWNLKFGSLTSWNRNLARWFFAFSGFN